MKTITLSQIKASFNFSEMLEEIEKSFIYFSEKKILCAPISQYHFPDKEADIHIKSGHLLNDKFFFIKIAAGFSENHKFGLDNSQGMIIALNTATGIPQFILNDEGYVTNLRTALAGTLCAKHFRINSSSNIGIMGNGIQAYVNAKFLKYQFPEINNLYLFGRDLIKIQSVKMKFENLGYNVFLTTDPNFVLANCKLIITTTSAKLPYISANNIQPESLIIAIGADDGIKQELDFSVLDQSSCILVDSINQCEKFGEAKHALIKKPSLKEKMYEIGCILKNKNTINFSKGNYTIVDLTGLAAQDIMISKYILNKIAT